MKAASLDLRTRKAAVAALCGIVLLAVGTAVNSTDTVRGYLGAALALMALPVGALVLAFMMDVIGGAWRDVLGGQVRATTALLPASALVFMPVVIGMLANAWDRVPDPHWSAFKSLYLQPWFLAARAVGYFTLWHWLRFRLSRSRCTAGFGALALVVLTLTISLAAVDWAMSTNPDFSSSIYGLIFLARVALAGLAAAIIIYGNAHRASCPMLGALFLSSLLLWAYMHAMQFLIVWAGDRPDEIVWYMARSSGLWLAVLLFVGVGFVGPFTALLSPRIRANPKAMAWIARCVLLALILEGFWLVLPGRTISPWPAGLGASGGLLVCASLAAVVLLGKRTHEQ
jgi:hypothetical protein